MRIINRLNKLIPMSDSLHPQQELWRYMKLSTFFLLMRGKAWFPSVASLRSGDPLEGMLADSLAPELVSELMKSPDTDILDQWLLDSLPDSMRSFHNLKKGNPSLLSNLLAKQYTHNLARRRLAWCWFASALESSAMWSIYGGLGVAVKTNVQSLMDALPKTKQFNIDMIGYVDRRPSSHRNLRAVVSDRPDLWLRPHLLKAVEYEHEKEVRVTGFCSDDVDGLMIAGIDSHKLVKDVVISPLFSASEAEAIRDLIANQCGTEIGERTRQSSLHGRELGDEFSRRYEEEFYGQSDEQLRLEELPSVFRQL